MKKKSSALEKPPTNIRGLYEIAFGGAPTGRTTLTAGRAGSGKTTMDGIPG